MQNSALNQKLRSVTKTTLATRVQCGLQIQAIRKLLVSLVFLGFCFFTFLGSANAQVLLNGWGAGHGHDDCWPTKEEACTKNGGIPKYNDVWSFGMTCRFLYEDSILERYGCKALPNPHDVYYCSYTQNIHQCFYEAKADLYLSLIAQSPPNPRPKGTEGKDPKSSTHELIAKVMEGSAPKAGVTVTFKVDVVPMTGGHGHHDANRPKGSVPPSGVTDANGEIKLTFQASEVAGSHTITATCNDCTNKTVNKNVDVRVPDLQPLSPNPSQNSDGKYLYALTAKDPTHVGTSGGRQRGEYYLTAKAEENLYSLVRDFAAEDWGTVAFNDASLVWGGLYDIDNDWMESHQGHRLGEEIDISFTRANNPISVEKRKQVYKTLCDAKKTSVPYKILYHIGGKGPHYHVYLLGRKNGCFTLPT